MRNYRITKTVKNSKKLQEIVKNCEELREIVRNCECAVGASLIQLTLTIANLYGVALALAHYIIKLTQPPSYLRYPFRK